MNTFTKYPNKILETLPRTALSGSARQVLDVIIRQTYGWHKEEDAISVSQFEQKTGLSRSSVMRGIKMLVDKNIIFKNDVPYTNKYRVNKKVEEWKGVSELITGGIENDTESSVRDDTHKRNNKEINTKEITEGVFESGYEGRYDPEAIKRGQEEMDEITNQKGEEEAECLDHLLDESRVASS